MNATQLRIASSLVALGASTSIAGAQPSAEPQAPSVTVGAYLETYYQLDFRRPSNRITNVRGYDNRDRTFTLSNAALDFKGERGPLTVLNARALTPSSRCLDTVLTARPARS